MASRNRKFGKSVSQHCAPASSPRRSAGEPRLLKLQAQLAAVKLLIVDELGYVPLLQTGAELLFEIFSQRHERGSTIVTSNLPLRNPLRNGPPSSAAISLAPGFAPPRWPVFARR
jgi:hypothetical protein